MIYDFECTQAKTTPAQYIQLTTSTQTQMEGTVPMLCAYGLTRVHRLCNSSMLWLIYLLSSATETHKKGIVTMLLKYDLQLV